MAHALRSSAAYIGAVGLFDICIAWKGRTDSELLNSADDEINKLNIEFTIVKSDLLDELKVKAH